MSFSSAQRPSACGGWAAILSSLKSLLETGEPLTIRMEPPDSKVLAGISKGWPAILSSLKTYLERGAPMAMTERLRRERGE